MKITHVTPGIIPIPPNGWGAIEKIIWEYHQNLQSMGVESHIKYLSQVDYQKGDIVHIHIANLALEAHKMGIPYIFSLHDHHVVYYGKESFNYKQNLEAIKKSVISFCHAEYLVDYFNETDKLFYLSHGVNTNFFKVDNQYRGEHKLLCLANNGIGGDSSYDRKGFRYAIEAAKKLDLPITIAGPDNNREFFNNHSDLLEYDNLTLVFDNPNENDILELYKNHSIFLHPSSLEAGHPNLTLLEAISCNLPIVGTYTGSQKINGMIVTERNSESIANSIQEIINNYNFYVDQTNKSREKFDWGIITNRLLKMYKLIDVIKKEYTSIETKNLLIDNIENTQKINIKKEPNLSYNIHFVNNPFFEILGDTNKEYDVEFYDDDLLVYHTKLKSNMWAKLNREYFTNWKIKVYDEDELIYNYKLDFTDKKVFISFESSSLGDNISWIPYVLEFKNKHNCRVVVSTFWDKLFKDVYPEIEFIEPGTVVHDLFAMYKIGWFYDKNKEPVLPSTIPLQKAITNILGLEFKEIKPKIYFEPKERLFKEKYIAIANESTSGLKLWNNPNGWTELVSYLKSKGYRVVNVSKNGDRIDGTTKLKDTSIENTMNVIYHSEFFIGLSSGLSWLSWALDKHVVMISNFTEEDHEFISNCTRITNTSVCHGCWNNPLFKFDKGDWNWCPEHKGTNRHFECHKSITSQMVIEKIQHLLT
jgi:autotransporter strand-loop-strand O-heptosyltransferase